MSVTKRINGNYTITTALDSTANVTITTNTVYIDGNLRVGGNTQSITQTNTDITDNIITLNKGETGPGVSLDYSGVVFDRGDAQFQPEIRWSEPDQRWQVTNDGSTYANISASSGSGSLNIIDDLAPQLGGNLDVLARTIFSSNTQQVKIDSNLAMIINTVTPTAISNYNTVYAAAPDTGGSGVYQTSLVNSDELVSRNRALVFSLIL